MRGLCTGLKRFLSLWEPWEGSTVPFLQISPYLILSVLALTLTPGISGGNYFPAFPPTCHPSKTVDSADKWKVGFGLKTTMHHFYQIKQCPKVSRPCHCNQFKNHCMYICLNRTNSFGLAPCTIQQIHFLKKRGTGSP